jgi:hypothetical protein
MPNRLLPMFTKLTAPLYCLWLIAAPQIASAQPEDWVTTPSAYEFSMTLTYTISIDGLVGANSTNAAAIFGADGTCRGWGTADFMGTSGFYTGLILVYSNSASEPGLEVRIWDATLDSLPQCLDEVDFVANGIQGSLADPVVFYAVYDPLVGCTDANACNYLSTAISDNGSCIYPGCNDEAACNYVVSSPCYDSNTCVFPDLYFDCNGDCLNDFDGDGICDELEIGGCLDDRACNYNPSATDDDCSCSFPFYPLDCDGNCYIDTDGDGVCEADEVLGCDDPVSCNFEPNATDNNGTCAYCCYSYYDGSDGFSIEVERYAGLGTEVPGLEGLTTFRVYLTCSDSADRVTAVLGSGGSSTFIGASSNFHQAPNGGLLITDIDSTLFADDLSVTLDSWLTIGLDHPTPGDGEEPISATSGLWSTLFELGEDVFIGGNSNDGWSVSSSSNNGIAGSDLKVLIGQFTSSSPIEGSLNVTVIPSGSSTPIQVNPLFIAPPCGCTDETACNYDPDSNYDDGTCQYPAIGVDCAGNCSSDSDGDGVCDEDEIQGCTDFLADNFSPLATDDFGCQFLGCTYLDAENYDAGANDDDGSCAFSLMNPCPTDLNGDGITAAGDILEMLAFYGQPCQ